MAMKLELLVIQTPASNNAAKNKTATERTDMTSPRIIIFFLSFVKR